MPVFYVDTMGKDIPVKGGTIHIRVYTPKTGKDSYPVIVYYHGGGFVIADLDVYMQRQMYWPIKPVLW